MSAVSTPPHPCPGGVALLRYTYNPLTWVTDYRYLGFPSPWLPDFHPWLHSVVELHSLSGRCQCLGLGGLRLLGYYYQLRSPLDDCYCGHSLLSVSGTPCALEGEVTFVFWWDHTLSFPVTSSTVC